MDDSRRAARQLNKTPSESLRKETRGSIQVDDVSDPLSTDKIRRRTLAWRRRSVSGQLPLQGLWRRDQHRDVAQVAAADAQAARFKRRHQVEVDRHVPTAVID